VLGRAATHAEQGGAERLARACSRSVVSRPPGTVKSRARVEFALERAGVEAGRRSCLDYARLARWGGTTGLVVRRTVTLAGDSAGADVDADDGGDRDST
jgi:hypothetical protein